MSKRHRGFSEDYRPRKATQDLIERVLAALAEYADHLPLTIRQIFYRLVGARTADGSVSYPKTERAYEFWPRPSAKRGVPGLSTSPPSATTV
jgi:hypothetical protein